MQTEAGASGNEDVAVMERVVVVADVVEGRSRNAVQINHLRFPHFLIVAAKNRD
jgi:hypothetical protein